MAGEVAQIVSRVRTQLIDTVVPYRWSDAELLQWVTDAQRTMVAISPSTSSKRADISLVAGSRQAMPAETHILLNLVCNRPLGADGRAVRVVSQELMDGIDVNWRTATQSQTVQCYTYDADTPLSFAVYPPNDGSGIVEAHYAVMPPEVTLITDPLVVQPIYQTAVFDYVLFRAHSKDADYAAGQALAAPYLQLFMAAIGAGEQSQAMTGPNQDLGTPVNPSRSGSS